MAKTIRILLLLLWLIFLSTFALAQGGTQIDLTKNVKGILPVVNGGTGSSSISIPAPSTTTPTMDGAAAVGTGTTYARADHVHPTDTSRLAASAVSNDGTLGGGSPSTTNPPTQNAVQTYVAAHGGGGAVVATLNLTNQNSNVPLTTLYTVPVGSAGMYRLNAYLVVTQQATLSSVLPNISVSYTDQDTGLVPTPPSGYGLFVISNSAGVSSNPPVGTNSNQANQLDQSSGGGTGSDGILSFNAKAGTVIQLSSSGYSSTGATPMQYAAHFKLEYLGQ